MDADEKFRLGRELISHENELVNHRMTWLLLITGFLFSAFFTLIGSSDKVLSSFGKLYLVGAAVAIAFVGIYAAVTAAHLILQAHGQIAMVREWWEKQQDTSHLPKISAVFENSFRNRWISTTGLARFIAVLWVLVLIVTIGCLYLPQASASGQTAANPPMKPCSVIRGP